MGWSSEYYYGEKLLTKEGWRTTSYITEQPYHTQERMLAQQNFNRFYADDQDPRPSYMREMLNLSVGVSVYGFGEKFTTFVKNGQSVQIWNGDGGTCSEYSYKSIPFYVSNRGYGVFVNHARLGRVDRVVAHHGHRGAERLEIADDRIDERIVIIYHQNACGIGHHAPINV